MDPILHLTPPVGQARNTLRNTLTEADAGPQSGPCPTSVHTCQHLGRERSGVVTEVALACLEEVRSNEHQQALMGALRGSGLENLVKKAERMDQCSTSWMVHVTPTSAGGSPNHCNVRGCTNCHHSRYSKPRKKALAIFESLDKTKKRARFMTLTQQDIAGESYQSAMDRILAADLKFRRRKEFKHYVSGWIRKLEATFNPDEDWWHVHLHYITTGRFWPQAELSVEWENCGGGEITDIRAAHDPEELLKYSLKNHKTPPDKLVEWSVAMEGKRDPDEEVQEEPTAEELEAFHMVVGDTEEETDLPLYRVFHNEDRLTWWAWQEPDVPEFVRLWALQRLREVMGDAQKLVDASERRNYRPD